MNYKNLEVIGLNETESRVYLAVLELGEAVVSRIAKKSGVKRTTVYISLEKLKSKGLIGVAKKFGVTRYFAEDPKILKKIMDDRKEKFDKLMPEILSVVKLMDHKPSVCYFEGKQSAQKIYNDVLKYKKQELLVWQSADNQVLNKKYEEFEKERLVNRIKVRAITSLKNKSERIKKQKNLRDIKYAPYDLYFNQTEIYLYGKNKIGIISPQDDLAILIESGKVREALDSIFNILWEKL